MTAPGPRNFSWDFNAGPFGANLVAVAGRNPQPNVSQYAVNASNFSATAYHQQKYGYVEQWNFGIQRELPGGFFADVAYAGSHGVHLEQFNTNVNQIPDRFISAGSTAGCWRSSRLRSRRKFARLGILRCISLQPGPSRQLGPGRSYSWVNLTVLSRNTADCNYNGFGCCGSTYNSLQATVTKRFQGGGTLLVAYTNAKLMSNTDTLTSWLEGGTTGGVGGSRIGTTSTGERSLSSQDVSQRLVISYVLDLPFGQGKKYLSGVSGVAGKVVSGWGIDGITTFQRGFPVKISYGARVIALGRRPRNRRPQT